MLSSDFRTDRPTAQPDAPPSSHTNGGPPPNVHQARAAHQCSNTRCECQRDGGNVHCPAHTDTTPSLSINESNGKLLFKCHAGCTQAAVLEAIKRGAGHVAPPTAAPNGANGSRSHKTFYRYRAADGTLLFEVVRTDFTDGTPKKFAQRQPDGNGGWVYKLEGVTPVLYNLADVLAATDVIICEGEKAADAVNGAIRDAGLYGPIVATTSPMGAGKWRDHYGDAIRGKAVILLPDNDTQGRDHMATVAGSLEGKAASVNVITLPDLPPKGDAVDYLANGGTVQDILRMVGATAEEPGEPPPNEPTPHYETFTFASMAAIPRLAWLIRGLLIEKISSVLSADTGNFKSFIALAMALCIATGREFFGREVKQGAVVYVAAEGFYTLLDRATAWAQYHECELPENFHILKVPVNLADPATVQLFGQHIESIAPAFVVLDTLSQCAVGANENDNAQMADFVRGMMALCNSIGAHVQVLHHNGKSTGTFRGASSIKANVDAHISLDRPEGDDQNTIFIRCEKQRGRPFEAFALRGEEITLPYVDEFGDPITSLVFTACNDAVAAKIERHASSKRADKTREKLLELFDLAAIEGAPYGGVKVGFWKNQVEAADPPICEERTFWKYRKALENDGTIEQCGTHNGSPVFQRTASTASTASTAKCSVCSSPHNAASRYCKYCNNPLGVAVRAVENAVPENAEETVLFESETEPKKKKSKNSVANEPYTTPPTPDTDDSEVEF